MLVVEPLEQVQRPVHTPHPVTHPVPLHEADGPDDNSPYHRTESPYLLMECC
jgi:hypothetical protein